MPPRAAQLRAALEPIERVPAEPPAAAPAPSSHKTPLKSDRLHRRAAVRQPDAAPPSRAVTRRGVPLVARRLIHRWTVRVQFLAPQVRAQCHSPAPAAATDVRPQQTEAVHLRLDGCCRDDLPNAPLVPVRGARSRRPRSCRQDASPASPDGSVRFVRARRCQPEKHSLLGGSRNCRSAPGSAPRPLASVPVRAEDSNRPWTMGGVRRWRRRCGSRTSPARQHSPAASGRAQRLGTLRASGYRDDRRGRRCDGRSRDRRSGRGGLSTRATGYSRSRHSR